MLRRLTVARPPQARGVATALLALVIARLGDGGVGVLVRAASAASMASLRGHLTSGFQLAEDPSRKALRPHRFGAQSA